MLFLLHGKDAGQAAGAGAAQDAHQNGFRLVVERVRGGDLVCLAFANELEKPLVTQLTRGGLQTGLVLARVGGDISGPSMQLQSELPGQLFHELLVSVGLGAPDSMMEMRHR